MLRSSFLTGPRGAGPSWRYQDGVGHRHIRGRVAIEDELGLDHPLVHRRGRFLWRRAKNSVNACATSAEIVLPDSPAPARTPATSTAGSRTANTVHYPATASRPPTAAP